MIGETLAHYRILSKLGEGGMGEVYLAQDTKLDRQVAIKVLPDEMAQDTERLARFEREAKSVAALNHPHVVTLYSIEEAKGRHFLTMEYVDGEGLDHDLPEEGLPLERVLEIGIELSDALSAAHQRGIVHRDLKPANLMVARGEDGRKDTLKVLDFGLAKLLDSDPEPESGTTADAETRTRELTGEGRVLGTMPYMSPEQVKGEALDDRSDIFSLGVVLYELATGKRPFAGDSGAEIMSSILRDAPPPAHELRGELPRHLGRILGRCLEKAPEDRAQTAKDVHSELRALRRELEDRPSESATAVASSATEASEDGARQLRSSLPGLRLAAVSSILLLAALGVWWVLTGRSTQSPSVEDSPLAVADASAEMASVAVLPFVSLSTSEEDEVFCDGLTEELIHSLVRFEGLSVPARTTVFALKGKDLGIRETARQLGVAHVLEGSVRRAGDQLRVTAQLIKAEDGFPLWSESWDRELADVFAIQDEISQAIVTELRGRLSAGEQQALSSVRSENGEAYGYYLQAQGYFRRQGRKDFTLLAQEMYEKAIGLDPGYAPAWAGLAILHAAAYRTYESTPERLDVAMEASARAIELAPELADAHAARGYALAVNRRFDEAEESFEEALRLDRRVPLVYERYGISEGMRGDLAKAASLYEKQVELAPDEYESWMILPQLYRSLGRPEDEQRALRETVRTTQRRLDLDPDDTNALLFQATAWASLGDPTEAIEVADRLVKGIEDGESQLLYNAACVYALSGEISKAVALLERSYEGGMVDPDWMEHDSDLDSLREDPDFIDLMKRMRADLEAR